MGGEYVLPIEQSKVTQSQAKVKKILEETDSQAKQIISNADNKAQIITETANTEATRIIGDARKRAELEYDSVKDKAYQEGFEKGRQEGLEQFKKDAVEGLKAIDNLAKTNFDMKKNIIDSATYDIVELISIIADKVCHQTFDPQTLYDITTDAIRKLNDKENITIIVSPDLVDAICSMEPNFRDEFPTLQYLKITEDSSLSADGVIVETLNTRLDSRISSQIAEITRQMLTGGTDNGME